jgi:predicted nucleotidyltransferase
MNQTTSNLKRLLEDTPGLELAFLFGSRASGKARPDSDLDLAVLLDRPLPADLKLRLTESVADAFGCAVDVIDLFGVPEPITGEVLKGQRLIGTDESHARLMTRHLTNVADFLPLRQRLLDERRTTWIR